MQLQTTNAPTSQHPWPRLSERWLVDRPRLMLAGQAALAAVYLLWVAFDWTELSESSTIVALALVLSTSVLVVRGTVAIHDRARSRAQAAALDSERRLRALVAALDDIVFEFDADGTYLNVWAGDEGLLSSPREQLLGRRIAEAIDEEVSEKFVEIFRHVLQTGQPEIVEYALQVGAGQRTFVGRANAVRWPDGICRSVAFVSRDVTEQRQAEEEIERERREKAALLESTSEGIYGVDRAGRCTFVNRAVADMLGYAPDELIGANMHDLIHHSYVDGTPYPTADCPISQAFQSGQIVRWGDEVLWRRDDTYVHVEYSSAPVLNDGQIAGAVVTLTDVTDRKRAEEERERLLAREQATLAQLRATQQQVVQQERVRALGQMASGIAHDFNNTLAPIVGFSDLLLEQPEKLADRARTVRFLEMIQAAGRDAEGVVRRLRELYRQRETDDLVEPVHLDEVVAQVISLTQFSWKDQAQAEGREIVVNVDVPHLPMVSVSRAELREALTNLILNAVDAMPDGGAIEIGAQIDETAAILTVRDSGLGMSDEVRLRCLDPFFTTKGEHGTGLGLGLVYGVVQRHGGTLEIDSAPGQGTTFRIRLPLGEQQLSEQPVESPTAPTTPLHILVVDDEARIRIALAEYLAIDGHTVETAVDGRDGLERFRAGRFDLVLTDRALPEMNGDCLAAAIEELAPDTPVVMLTGFGDLMTHHGIRPSGVDLVLGKPVTLASLREAIASVTTP
ncbi:MAG: PAS domain S-box protein [Chloroflexota bacterium]